jgi:hypothetical protein
LALVPSGDLALGMFPHLGIDRCGKIGGAHSGKSYYATFTNARGAQLHHWIANMVGCFPRAKGVAR